MEREVRKEAIEPVAAPETPSRRRFGRRIGQAIPYAVALLVLVGYFVWLISQMSLHASGGAAIPEATFGAVVLGVLAGGAAFVLRPRD